MALFNSLERGIVKNRRKRLAREIFHRHNGTIQRGAFAGMQMTGDANISQAAHGLKIFGLYETPVIDALAEWCPAKTLINIGAGDGYYSVGMVVAKMVEQSVCFEITEKGRDAIENNAELNDVRSRISIHGAADAESLRDVLEQLELSTIETLVLCDIEGGEFSLFDDDVLRLLGESRIIVELHDTLRKPPAPELRTKLFSQFNERFATTLITDAARRWEGISELESMHDIDRAIVTSEGRKVLGEWLVGAPTAGALPQGNRRSAA